MCKESGLAVVRLDEVVEEVVFGEFRKLGEIVVGHAGGLLENIDGSLLI